MDVNLTIVNYEWQTVWAKVCGATCVEYPLTNGDQTTIEGSDIYYGNISFTQAGVDQNPDDPNSTAIGFRAQNPFITMPFINTRSRGDLFEKTLDEGDSEQRRVGGHLVDVKRGDDKNDQKVMTITLNHG